MRVVSMAATTADEKESMMADSMVSEMVEKMAVAMEI